MRDYKAQVKHIEKVMHEETNTNLEELLSNMAKWREEESNTSQDYDLYIWCLARPGVEDRQIFGSRF